MIPPELNNQICSTGFCVLRACTDDLEPTYLFFALLTERIARCVETLQKGATYPAINDPDLFDQLIPLPPLDEQYKIGDALRACDAKIAALQQEAATLDELFRALLEELMTGRLSAAPLIVGTIP